MAPDVTFDDMVQDAEYINDSIRKTTRLDKGKLVSSGFSGTKAEIPTTIQETPQHEVKNKSSHVWSYIMRQAQEQVILYPIQVSTYGL